MKKEVRVGIIRWDSYTDSNLYFSYFGAKALSPKQYQEKVPFFGKIINGEKVEFPRYTEETFNKEMEYAEKAGIDYFIWFFYPANTTRPGGEGHSPQTVDEYGEPCCELDIVRRIYRKSKNKRNIKMCIQLTGGLLNEEEISQVCDDMAEDWYEKIDGRPLLYVYDIRTEQAQATILGILKLAEERGLKCPYIVNDKADVIEGIDVDAYGAYSMPSSLKPMSDFDTYNQMVIDRNEQFFTRGKQAVPHLSLGWNPMPRIETPVPWYSYPVIDYPPAPKGDELLKQAKALKALAESKGDVFSGHYSVFAWNEFEEGAWICPTLTKDGGIDTSHVEMLKEAIEYLKK